MFNFLYSCMIFLHFAWSSRKIREVKTKMPSSRKKHVSSGQRNFHGPQIRRIREERKYTLVDLCAILEEYDYPLDASNLGLLERGKRALSDVELHIFANALGVSVADLMAEPAFVEKEDLINALHNVRRRYPKR
jgi:hypothetical protein